MILLLDDVDEGAWQRIFGKVAELYMKPILASVLKLQRWSNAVLNFKMFVMKLYREHIHHGKPTFDVVDVKMDLVG
jgi:hypothetical protein